MSRLIKELRTHLSVMRDEVIDGIHYASFESGGVEENGIVTHYCSLIEGLSNYARKLWDSSRKMTFDIGYESGGNPNNSHSVLSEASIQKLASIG